MTVIQFSLREELSRELAARASASGRDVQAYLAELVERDLRRPTYAEIFAPVQDATAGHGMSEAELARFLYEELQASRRERRERGRP